MELAEKLITGRWNWLLQTAMVLGIMALRYASAKDLLAMDLPPAELERIAAEFRLDLAMLGAWAALTIFRFFTWGMPQDRRRTRLISGSFTLCLALAMGAVLLTLDRGAMSLVWRIGGPAFLLELAVLTGYDFWKARKAGSDVP